MSAELIASALLSALSILLILVGVQIHRGRLPALAVGTFFLLYGLWSAYSTSQKTVFNFRSLSREEERSLELGKRPKVRALAIQGPRPETFPAESGKSPYSEQNLTSNNWSSEQRKVCLDSLETGLPCVVAESLPGRAQSALVLVIQNESLRSVAYEFGLPIDREAPNLALPREGLQPQFDRISEITQGLVPFRGEDDVSELLTRLRARTEKGAIHVLELEDTIVTSEQLRRWRSFFSLISQQHVWISDFRGIQDRFLNAPQLSELDEGGRFVIFADRPLHRASMTLLSPTPIKELPLNVLIEASNAREVELFYTGPRSVRVVFNRLDSPTIINANDALDRKGSGAPFWTTPALQVLKFSILLSMIAALGATLLQTFTSWKRDSRRSFYIEGFSYVGFVSCLIFWLSLNRLDWDNHEKSELAGSELSNEYLFWSQWPEAWFTAEFKSQVNATEQNILGTDGLMRANNKTPLQSLATGNHSGGDPWVKLFGDHLMNYSSDHLSKNEELSARHFIAPSVSAPTPTDLGSKALILLDRQEARNWYFRRSPLYSGTLTGWSTLMVGLGQDRSVSELPELLALNPDQTIAIIPDPRFLPEAGTNQILDWIRKGGTVVSSFLPDLRESGQLETHLNNRENWLKSLNVDLSSLSLSSYQLIKAGPSQSYEISTPHWIQTDSNEERNWFLESKLGKGRIVHLGFGPVLSNQQQVWQRILIYLRGGNFAKVAWPGTGCATALGIMPWGASEAIINKWRTAASAAGLNWFWASDGESLANIWNSRGAEMMQKDIAIIDQPNRENPVAMRFASAALYKAALKRDPIFVGEHKPNSIDGPEAVYLSSMELADPWEQSFSDWISNCKLHRSANVALVRGQDLVKLLRSVEALSRVKPQPIRELVRIWSSINAKESQFPVKIDPQNPLLWLWEGESH